MRLAGLKCHPQRLAGTEQMLLAIPMKVICRSDCRGLCPQCGANMNSEECRCEARSPDPRLAPLARLKQDWFKKQ